MTKQKETDHYSQHYQMINQVDEAAYQRQIQEYDFLLSSLLPADKSARILELGCGVGFLLYYLASQGYKNLVGVDQSEGQFAYAKKFCPDSLQLIHQDVQDFLSSPPELFEQIILFDLLEHIPKKEIAPFIKNLYNALKLGGSLIIRTPNMASPLGVFSRYIDFTHEVGFTEFSLRQVFFKTPFQGHIELIHLPLRGSLISRLVQWIYRHFCRRLYMLEGRIVPTIFDRNLLVIVRKEKDSHT